MRLQEGYLTRRRPDGRVRRRPLSPAPGSGPRVAPYYHDSFGDPGGCRRSRGWPPSSAPALRASRAPCPATACARHPCRIADSATRTVRFVCPSRQASSPGANRFRAHARRVAGAEFRKRPAAESAPGARGKDGRWGHPAHRLGPNPEGAAPTRGRSLALELLTDRSGAAATGPNDR